jgi:hypothetical protein
VILGDSPSSGKRVPVKRTSVYKEKIKARKVIKGKRPVVILNEPVLEV